MAYEFCARLSAHARPVFAKRRKSARKKKLKEAQERVHEKVARREACSEGCCVAKPERKYSATKATAAATSQAGHCGASLPSLARRPFSSPAAPRPAAKRK